MNTARVQAIDRGGKVTLLVKEVLDDFYYEITVALEKVDGYKKGMFLSEMTEYGTNGFMPGVLVHFRTEEKKEDPVDRVWPSI